MTETHEQPGDAGDVANALYTSWQLLANPLPGGWARRAPGAIAVVTHLPLPTLNGVMCGSADANPSEVAELLGAVRDTGLPHCLQLPTGGTALRALALERAMTRGEDIPLMRLDGVPRESISSALHVRRLTPEDAAVHADIAARGFGAPVAVFAPLVAQPLVSTNGLALYVGEVDGDPVTTGLGLTIGDHVGPMDIATLPEHRRRGYGAAITARIVRDGYAAGARWAWLQSTKDGYSVYEQLGFTTVGTWECWIAT
jgi:GNAT superfamily N-acetyltransferase